VPLCAALWRAAVAFWRGVQCVRPVRRGWSRGRTRFRAGRPDTRTGHTGDELVCAAWSRELSEAVQTCSALSATQASLLDSSHGLALDLEGTRTTNVFQVSTVHCPRAVAARDMRAGRFAREKATASLLPDCPSDCPSFRWNRTLSTDFTDDGTVLSWDNAIQTESADVPARTLEVETRVRTPLGLPVKYQAKSHNAFSVRSPPVPERPARRRAACALPREPGPPGGDHRSPGWPGP